MPKPLVLTYGIRLVCSLQMFMCRLFGLKPMETIFFSLCLHMQIAVIKYVCVSKLII